MWRGSVVSAPQYSHVYGATGAKALRSQGTLKNDR